MAETLDERGPGQPAASVRHSACIFVLLECDRPGAGAARYSLEGIERVFIGRGDERAGSRRSDGNADTLDVRIPGRWLSSAHARLVRVGDSWALEDLSSRNGTFVNGERIERTILKSDDLIEVGHTFLRVNPSMAAPSTSALDLECAPTDTDTPVTLQPMLARELEKVAKVAPSGVAVLILGDSGTGKEVLARWVHRSSRRRGSFVAVNCGAIPQTLVESTLFGHVKGAFSDAVRDELGFIRAAHEGTLFLDEIGDLPKASQSALLRVLQEREVVPVGATRPLPVDLRLVTATHHPLEDMAARGDFRSDLFARIAGFAVRLPALCERREDLGVVIASILRKTATSRGTSVTFTPDAARALFSYDWPLNAREVEQCLTAALALADDSRVEIDHLPPPVVRALERVEKVSSLPSDLTPRNEQLRLELLAQLARHKGNLNQVAREMGKARAQVYRWCRRFGVDPNAYRR